MQKLEFNERKCYVKYRPFKKNVQHINKFHEVQYIADFRIHIQELSPSATYANVSTSFGGIIELFQP